MDFNYKSSLSMGLAYIPPQMEVVRVAVEQGFSASDDGGMNLPDWEII